MVWILHISDLHRSDDFPINNLMLVESIKQDIADLRKSDEPIDLIVASGDIIQGSRAQSLETANEEVDSQYAETRSLLDSLIDLIAAKDWSRLVLVPGNHDVCWAYSKAAMKQLELSEELQKRTDSIKLFRKELDRVSSGVRWSWSNLAFYKVNAPEVYAQRFNGFSKFFNELPGDRPLWKNTDDHRFTIQLYDKHQIAVVGFCSCFNVDHLNHTGAIHPASIANAEEELRQQGAKDYLKIAVWHHNTKGGPTESDYMYDGVLESLTQFRYALGFHGHQHKSEFVYRYSAVDSEKTMAVISAASLCAGAWELPPGHNRGYNLIRVQDGKMCVWHRELHEISLMPVWRDSYKGSSIEVFLRPDAIGDRERNLKSRIIRMQDEGQNKEIVELIESENALTSPTFRAAWLDSVKQLHDNRRMAQIVPCNPAEMILVLEALKNLGDEKLLYKRLAEEWVNSEDASVQRVVSDLKRTLKVRGGKYV